MYRQKLGKPVAHNCGLLSLDFVLGRGVVSCYSGLQLVSPSMTQGFRQDFLILGSKFHGAHVDGFQGRGTRLGCRVSGLRDELQGVFCQTLRENPAGRSASRLSSFLPHRTRARQNGRSHFLSRYVIQGVSSKHCCRFSS